MLCRGNNSIKCRKPGSNPVYLNVYDLTPMNEYAYWLGLGVYHSGVQVHGVEYAYGAHEEATTGIFEGEPKQCEGFTFRKRILIGWTDMNIKEVKGFMEELGHEYKGTSYNLITKNCNHFCKDVCIRLTGNSIPSWVNRLAKIVPASISSTKVGIEDNKCNEAEVKAKLRSRSSRFTSSSSSPSSSEKSTFASPIFGRTRSHGRTVLHPCSPLMLNISCS
uniref:deSI-like protein At4g17486 isoform X2 n=1 Tax=Erigeron canadensis TaxID=72917 RepID=UPI001CB8FA46|nr:deSI-like protein At4g17486 isoform X2 [Erigeron canadensis]